MSLTVITPELVIFAIGFSTLLGIVSGVLPARRASKLQPTAALRYE
jgi:putative ABC transport system permease protein